MKPIKNIEPIAKWILRISLVAYIVFAYFSEVKTLNFHSVNYFINLLYVIFALLLLFGGFGKNATLTIISGIVLSIISAYKIYNVFSLSNLMNPAIYLFLLIFAVGLFFTSKGNA
jgi:hypothetical protein